MNIVIIVLGLLAILIGSSFILALLTTEPPKEIDLTEMVVPSFQYIKPKTNWALECDAHSKKITSQGGQDGILEWIFENIGTTDKTYVEFGFNTLTWDGGSGPNTRNLHELRWTGLLLDGSLENPDINLQKLWIKQDTIVNDLYLKGISDGIDYISVDIDSADCFVFREIACKMRPRVMTIEYNSNYPLEATIANIGGDYFWRGDRLYGCSLGTHALIAEECGYSIVAVVHHLDVFVVRNDLLINTDVPPLSKWAFETNQKVHSSGRQEDIPKYLCDYSIWVKTMDYATCTGQAVLDAFTRNKINL